MASTNGKPRLKRKSDANNDGFDGLPEIESIDLGDLVPMERNARKHTPHNIGLLVNSIQEVGVGRSGVIDEKKTILAGNGTYEALSQAGIRKVKVIRAKGDEWVVVQRIGLSEKAKKRLALQDNRAGEFSEWDFDILKDLASANLLDGLWTDQEIDWIKQGWHEDSEGNIGPYDPNGELFIIKIADVKRDHKEKLLDAITIAIKDAGLDDEYSVDAY